MFVARVFFGGSGFNGLGRFGKASIEMTYAGKLIVQYSRVS
jgi:hypothetical protein